MEIKRKLLMEKLGMVDKEVLIKKEWKNSTKYIKGNEKQKKLK